MGQLLWPCSIHFIMHSVWNMCLVLHFRVVTVSEGWYSHMHIWQDESAPWFYGLYALYYSLSIIILISFYGTSPRCSMFLMYKNRRGTVISSTMKLIIPIVPKKRNIAINIRAIWVSEYCWQLLSAEK